MRFSLPAKAAIYLLTVFSHVSASPNPIAHKGDDHPPSKNEVEAWEKYQECLPAYFELTDSNLRQSGTADWYAKYINKKAHAHPEEYNKQGEIPFFAAQLRQESNFRCSIHDKGCTQLPTCKNIVQDVKAHHPKLTTKDLLAEARRRYFAFKMYELMFKFLASAYDIYIAIQLNAIGTAEAAVKVFTPQPGSKSELRCVIYKALYDYGIGVFNFAFAGFPGPVYAIQFGMDYTKEDAVEMFNEMKIKEAAKAGLNNTANTDLDLKMDPAYLVDICNQVGGGRSDNNFVLSAELKKHITETFKNFRKLVVNYEEALAKGDALKNKKSHISVLLGSIEKNGISVALKKGLRRDEEKITKHLDEYIMSALYARSNSYAKCSCPKNATEDVVQELCSTQHANHEFRYCPPQEKTCACQIQSFTLQDTANHEIPLIGHAGLKARGLNESTVLVESYNHYQRMGFESHPKLSGMSLEEQSQESGSLDKSGISVPVCVSSQIKITDFEKDIAAGTLSGRKDLNQQFPCTCGDWRSNETAFFFKALGLSPKDTDVKTGVAHELLENICPHNLRHLAPLNRFFAFCALGLSFPSLASGTGGEPLGYMHNIKMNRGGHKLCSTILEEVKDMSEDKANSHFCSKSESGKNIFNQEREWSDSTVPFLKSHKRECAIWAGKHKDPVEDMSGLKNIAALEAAINGTVDEKKPIPSKNAKAKVQEAIQSALPGKVGV